MENTTDNILVTSAPTIEGYKIVKQFGMIASYTTNWSFMLIDKRMKAMTTDILTKAQSEGGNAVIGVKMMTEINELGSGGSVIMYGTAVLVQPV